MKKILFLIAIVLSISLTKAQTPCQTTFTVLQPSQSFPLKTFLFVPMCPTCPNPCNTALDNWVTWNGTYGTYYGGFRVLDEAGNILYTSGTVKITDVNTTMTIGDIYPGYQCGVNYDVQVLFTSVTDLMGTPFSMTWWYNYKYVFLSPIPTKPSGTTSLCQGTVSTSYSTSDVGSTSYDWNISPSNAGTISGTGTTATVNWSSSYSGTATLKVRGVFTSGNGAYSDGLSITVNPIPTKPNAPTGNVSVCPGTQVDYSTTGSTYATSYQWNLSPSNAGSVTGTGITGTVTWSSSYSGGATLSVTGKNSCGNATSDQLNITVNPFPGKAGTPQGTVTLCQNPADNMYSSAGASNAASYQWSISPSNAGIISGNTTAASVNWDNTFTGTATIKIAGVNTCGSGTISDGINVAINPLPLKASKPSGTASICQGTATSSCTTIGSNYSTSYEWYLSPSNAGNITGSGTSVTLNWNSTFYGTATVKVRGVNSCGYGDYSDEFNIQVNPLPIKANSATGLNSLCQNPDNSTYTTLGADNSTAFEWVLSPSTAGVINGSDKTAVVDWSSTYTGVATIKVRGTNACGSGDYSDNLIVTINALPAKAAAPTGQITLCQNGVNMNYATTGATNATSYQWVITPDYAGTISGTNTTGTVAWATGFTGNVTVKVRGVNTCGTGDYSDAVNIVVNPLPTKPNMPSGQTDLNQNPGGIAYTTSGSLNSTSYDWVLNPATAGNISGSTNNITVNWSSTFSGTATLAARGVNSCGNSSYSDPLTIYIKSLSSKAAMPSGQTVLCQNPAVVTYTTAGATGATSYEWNISPSNAGTITGTGTTANVTWATDFTGAVTIKVRGINSAGTGDYSDPLNVTVNPLPVKAGIPSGNVSTCQAGQNLGYTTAGALYATSYQWVITPSTAGNIAGTSTTGTVTWASTFTGTATIKVRGVNTCGNGNYSDELPITVNPLPVKPAVPTGSVDISQNPGSLPYATTASTGTASFEWVLSPSTAGTVSGNTNSVTVNWNSTFSGTATLTVRGVNSCGNSSYSDPLTITVRPIPAKAAAPTGQTTLCQNPAVVIYTTTGATNATSYEWVLSPSTAGTITGTGTTANVTWASTFTGSATIKVRGVNTAGNGDYSDLLNITINPLPVKAGIPNGNLSTCQGGSSLNYTTLGALYATSYQWNMTPSTAGTISGTSTTGMVSWASTFTGIATISVRGVNTCGTGSYSDELTITVNPLPVKPAVPTGSADISQNSGSLPYTTTASTGTASYEWVLSPSTAGTVSGNTNSVTVNWNSTFSGTATLTVRGVNSCGNSSYSNPLTITVRPLSAKAAIPTGQNNLCQNSQVITYSTAGATNATSYEWVLSPSTAGNITGTGTTANVTWASTFTGSATIKVRGINTAGNGDYSDPLNVTINPLPTKASTPTGSNSLCQNSASTSYITSGSGYATSYQWVITPSNAGTISGSATTSSVTWTTGYTGTATIKVRGINSCGMGDYSDELTVTVNPLPLQADIPTGAISLCQNPLNTTYQTAGSINATSYEWVVSPDVSGFVYGTTQSATVNFDNAYTGTVSIKVRGVNSCGLGSFSDALTVTIKPSATKPTTPSGKGSICQGDALTKYNTSSPNATSYTWTIDPVNAATLKSFNDSVYVSWASGYSGSAYISVTAVNSCGSVTSELKSVLINPKPYTPSKPLTTDYCKNQKVTLTSSNISNDNILWFDLAGNYLQTGNNVVINALQSSVVYKVVAKNNIGCISDSVTILANIQNVKADFGVDYTSITPGSKVTFSNKSVNASTYAWSFGDGFTATTANPSHFYNADGVFDVKLLITSNINCTDTLVNKGLVTVKTVTGIETEKVLGLTIYPNPAQDHLFIDTKNYEKNNTIIIRILSVDGKLMLTKKLYSNEINDLDITNLTNGVYIISLDVNGILSNKKIIKAY